MVYIQTYAGNTPRPCFDAATDGVYLNGDVNSNNQYAMARIACENETGLSVVYDRAEGVTLKSGA